MEDVAVFCFNILFCCLICTACCGEDNRPISSEPPRVIVNPMTGEVEKSGAKAVS